MLSANTNTTKKQKTTIRMEKTKKKINNNNKNNYETISFLRFKQMTIDKKKHESSHTQKLWSVPVWILLDMDSKYELTLRIDILK